MNTKKYSLLAPTMMALTLAVSTAYAQSSAPRAPAVHDEHSGAALTDGQIIQIVRTLNDAEIKQANEAVDESENADVKRLAQMIITDHENANEELDDLLDGDLDQDDSDLNEALAKKAEATHEMLDDLDDAAYDCAYLQKQVAQHEEAISLAKNQLLPHVKNAGVKQFLTAMGPKLESHLAMAQAGAGKASCK